MPLTVRPCTPHDLPRAVAVEKSAFASNPFTPILFPGPFPADALEFRLQEMASQMTDDPTTRWLCVVDTDRPGPTEQGLRGECDEGIAFAKWNLYIESSPGARPMRKFGEGCNVEACEMVFGGLARQRERCLGGRRCLYLHILVTDPAYGRRGAGGMLTQWGIDEAKKHNLPCYVESSTVGHELYKRLGFRDLELHSVDLSRFGATEPHETWAMIREAE
ncbi:hypothetical protein OHC33_008663 [Knufia fluminis]|uniref:N-acetyltransferase domain-containing protein n=1 Tax=Knufia fluminis TaxID=191047 RepID=A0AAN8I4P2_9EURO|nr:hypothetical protein OHC33_008663 [Knufia fluminis]